ncbi:hemolysin family protein [Ruminococcus sp.]|uniref:hemolysin family protein n=1 Tax=Ruminococcus sp. TaxID=41978 RepID=UPI0025DD1BA8|nr:hemolysin family protein [Ruminococcus sp.]
MKVLVIAILLMISAVCSATETAFSSCNRIRLKKLADEGSKSAKKALYICDNFDKALTAILIGNNVVNISSSSLATVLFTEKFGAGSVGIATIVMTVLVLIFGEILPKSLAKENSERFSILMAAPLSAFMFIITPLTAIFMGIKNGASKLVSSGKDQPSVTEEELKYIIDEIQDEGVLEKQESELVQSALDFDEITISEILVPRVNIEGVELHDDMEDIKKLFIQSKYSRLPVYEKDIDHIIGLIHQSDFFEIYLKGKKDISAIMNKPLYITENRKISDILRQMQRKKVHMAVVLDQYGGTEGICTLEDIIEELVGEIYDESDEEDTSFVKLGDGQFEASAELSVSDFLDRMGLPEDTIETERTSLGGWIMDILDRIPEQNEVVSCPPFEMTIKMEDEQKIDRIRFKVDEDEIKINKDDMEDENA